MADDRKHETIYYVNGEEERTDKERLEVREILESAGFTPADKYKLTRIKPKPIDHFDDRYDEEVDITDREEFEAKHKGPTPTS
jgi:hypothetical protein